MFASLRDSGVASNCPKLAEAPLFCIFTVRYCSSSMVRVLFLVLGCKSRMKASVFLNIVCLSLLLNKKAESFLVIGAVFENNPRFCLSDLGYAAC